MRLTAGTVFQDTKLPLTIWFSAIYHLTQSKGGMSSIELGRRLGIKQPTAWLMKHKLMPAMAAREAKKPKLAGRVEVDDAYLGGERSGGKRGRGAVGKTPVVAAVETIDRSAIDPPLWSKLTCRHLTAKALIRLALAGRERWAATADGRGPKR